MKQLKFEHLFAEQIIKGNRTSTLRIDDKNIQLGEKVQLVDKVSSNRPQEWEIIGELTIIGKQLFHLSDMPLELLKTTEIQPKDREELYVFLRRFYGESIGDTSIITLLTFRFSPYKNPIGFLDEQKQSYGQIPKEVILYADGGSRGNPGPSAAGFVIENNEGIVLESWNKYLGVTTNNQAEYHGLIAALEWCRQRGVEVVQVRLDSMLVINQMKGIFKVKNRDLWTLYESAKKLQGLFPKVTFTHIPRELNKRADSEVNKALDAVSGKDVVQ